MTVNLAFKNPVIDELKKTEASYNESLKWLMNAFDANSISNEYLKKMRIIIAALKKDSDDILLVLERLCPQLVKKVPAQRRLLEELPAESKVEESEETRCRSELYQYIGSFLRNYHNYAELFVTYYQEFELDCKSFNTIDEWLRANSPKNLGLSDHISTALQRGPRYKLLLTEVETKNDHINQDLLNTLKEISKAIEIELTKINDILPNMDKDYEDYLSNISDYTSHIPIPRQNIPELRNARNQLLTVISAVLKELEINKDISPITRNDILFKTQTMLLERNPEVQKNKIKNYRKIAANLPGHAMSGKKTAVLGCLMLALATALAAAVILGAEFSLSATVIGITTVAVVAPAAACTFFISRRQTGLAQAASQLANTFESCPDAVKSARR